MSDTERFTLVEARRRIAEQECSTHGHDWDVISPLSGIPTRILCSRCGKSYRVEQPTT